MGLIKGKRKPIKCPQCGVKRVAKIIYGMQVDPFEFMDEIAAGKIVMAGCCIEILEEGGKNYRAEWQCVDCGIQIHKELITED